MTVIEEARCLSDEIARQRRIVRRAGDDTRVSGYNGQLATMVEVGDLQRNQQLLLSMLKSIRVDPGDGKKLTRSDIGKMGAAKRWGQ